MKLGRGDEITSQVSIKNIQKKACFFVYKKTEAKKITDERAIEILKKKSGKKLI